MHFSSPVKRGGGPRESAVEGALAHVPANRVVVAPDCGMKYLPRAVAFAKMKAMAEGAALVRRELNGASTCG
jgi:5-methyltetrahydropteroyltriglutamate--homocysteine methyltransferase